MRPNILNLSRLSIGSLAIFGIPNLVYAECANDILGKWQLSSVEIEGHTVNDDSQSWEFMANGTVRFLRSRPAIDTSAAYSCDGDIIDLKSAIPDRLKILKFDGATMAWESLEHGGIFHVVRVQ